MTRDTRHFIEVVLALLAGVGLGFVIATSSSAASRPAGIPDSGLDYRPLAAPHGPLPSPSSATRTGPARIEVSPDPTVPPASSIEGSATWYCSATSACTAGYGPSDLVAAIDPTLGIAKGTRVTVTHEGSEVTVRIVDVCACAGSRVIDLTSGAFKRLAPLSAGRIRVTLAWGGPSVTVPPTDR